MEDRQRLLYKKEIKLTLVFSALLMLMGHTATLFVVFPGLQGGSFWGFPRHYIIPILTGWFGMAVASWLMTKYCNKFDDEQQELSNDLQAPATVSKQVFHAGSVAKEGE